MMDCALRLRKFMSIDLVRISICLMVCGCSLLAQTPEAPPGCKGAADFTRVERLLQGKQYDEAARALDETRNCDKLSAIGEIRTPSIADLFVAVTGKQAGGNQPAQAQGAAR